MIDTNDLRTAIYVCPRDVRHNSFTWEYPTADSFGRVLTCVICGTLSNVIKDGDR